jgi:hypothetical protein
VALGKAFQSCGKRLAGKKGETKKATVMWAPDKGSIAGTCRCNNVHMDPWCMSRILAVRASNAQLMADGLIAGGYGLHFGTSTLRHYPRQAYGTVRKGQRGGLVAILHDGWKGAYGSAGRRWRDLRDTFGIIGYERAFEDTFGWDTGFHLHWHTLWVTKTPLTDEQQLAFRRALAQAWADAVKEADGYDVSLTCDRPNCPCGGEGHGTDLRALNGDDAGQAARYLYKDGDKGTAKIGLELSRTDFKSGRLDGRMGPLELGDVAAAELAQLGRPGPHVEKYRERERGVFQIRKQYRTQNLNKLVKELGIKQDTRTEAQITEEGEGLKPIAVIPAPIWYSHIAYRKGRRLQLVKAAELGGVDSVRRLVESWGLVWGKDVLDPLPAEELMPGDMDAEQLVLQEERQQSPAEAKFRARHREVTEDRADDVAAAMDRFRNPRQEIRLKVSLTKPIRAMPPQPYGKDHPTVNIPRDLDSWTPSDVQNWLSALEHDDDVTDEEFDIARRAADLAIVGEAA